MKQKQLAAAIKKTLRAEVLLSAAFMTTAYAQTAPAQGAAAPVAAPVATSGVTGRSVTTLEKVEITGSLLKSADKVGFNG